MMSFPASCCKFEMKYAISVLGSRRGGWSVKHFGVVLKVFEYGVHTCEIGLMYSKGLDPRGENTLYAYADASLGVPRSYGCRIVMMNGAAVSLRAKKHISTDPSTCESAMHTGANAKAAWASPFCFPIAARGSDVVSRKVPYHPLDHCLHGCAWGQWNYRSNETQNARAFKPV